MEAASTSETKTSITIPKAILHDHPYFSFSEVPKQGDHEYGGHCVVQFTNFNKTTQFGDGMSPNMMITSVPPASIFEGDSDPDSSDDPHQNLVQLTKADLTRASQMQRDPSLRTSRRENKGKTSKYKDEEVDLFNNRRKTPQKKTGAPAAKEKAQPKTPKMPSEESQEVAKSAKKGQAKGKKAKKTTEQNASEESTSVGEEPMQVDTVPLIEEAKRNGEQQKDTPKSPKNTPKRGGRKSSSRAANDEKQSDSVPVTVEEAAKNGISTEKADDAETEKETVKKSPGKRARGRAKRSAQAEEKAEDKAEEKEEEKKDEPPAKRRRGSAKKAEEEEKKKPEKAEKTEKAEKMEKTPTEKSPAEKTPAPSRGRRGAAATPAKSAKAEAEETPAGRKTRRNNNQAVETPAKATPKTARTSRSSASTSSPTETKTEVETEPKQEPKEPKDEPNEEPKEEVTTEPEPANKQTSRTPKSKKAEQAPKSKAKKKKEEVVKEEPPPIMFTPCDVAAADGDPWGRAVPMELLTRILNIVKQEMGLLSFVSRTSQVCKLWYEATKHPNLWRKVDLSKDNVKKYKKSFHWLCKNRLQQTAALNLSGWESLKQADIQVLVNNAKALESLDLSGCNKLGFESLQTLIDKLDKLNSISLSRASVQAVQNKPLIYLAEKKNAELKRLDLSENNSLVKFEASLRSIMKNCPNLEYLNLNSCMFSTQFLNLPLTKLQTFCPKIKELLVAQSLFKIADASAREQRECPGFVQLEKLNIGRSTIGRMGKFRVVTDDILGRFTKNAEGLKVLDVSGCLHITAKGIGEIPAKNIERLHMSQCKAASQHEFLTVILNWSHSLKELDLSGNSMEPAHLKQILETCSHLNYIDVNGCRGLPWAMRKGYSGVHLKDLMEELNTLIKEAPGASN